MADLTPAEMAFRALLAEPQRYGVWATEVRARWEQTPKGKAAVAARDRQVGLLPSKTRKAAA